MHGHGQANYKLINGRFEPVGEDGERQQTRLDLAVLDAPDLRAMEFGGVFKLRLREALRLAASARESSKAKRLDWRGSFCLLARHRDGRSAFGGP